jgi:hypothetical protein
MFSTLRFRAKNEGQVSVLQSTRNPPGRRFLNPDCHRAACDTCREKKA